MEKVYEFHFAPLQGYADSVFRNAFAKYFGGVDVYYTPFIRIEKGDFRRRDVRDIEPGVNRVPALIPQVLSGTPEEFRVLTEMVKSKGYAAVDLNLGCPFPLIAGRKKGAGMLPYPERVAEVLRTMLEFPELDFSLKMRLGWEDKRECLVLVDVINSLPLKHVTLHARTGKQQYKGFADREAFGAFYESVKHPLFYNGDLLSVEDIYAILDAFPAVQGVSVGRGLLTNPWLALEFKQGEAVDEGQQREGLRAFHQELFDSYSEVLQGEVQLLNKMKSLWEYFLPVTDRKWLKMIKKSNRISQYREAVQLILG